MLLEEEKLVTMVFSVDQDKAIYLYWIYFSSYLLIRRLLFYLISCSHDYFCNSIIELWPYSLVLVEYISMLLCSSRRSLI